MGIDEITQGKCVELKEKWEQIGILRDSNAEKMDRERIASKGE